MDNSGSQQSQESHSGQQQYTTVGSVWQPQSVPIQPPLRRGRALKSSLPEPYAVEPYSTNQYYSPLQQNFDRAISPRLLDRNPQSNIEWEGMHYTKPGDPGYRRSNGDDHMNMNVEIGDQVNSQLYRMSTQGLTNLASYPNPMQKEAQKILTKAKQHPLSMQHQLSDSANEHRVTVPPPGIGYRTSRSDPVAAENLLHSDRGDGYSLPSQPLQPLRPNYLNTTAIASRERDGYPSILSKGPGAPQPLTAGPPGQRQYQPSTFTPSTSSSQKGPEKMHESGSFDENPQRFPQLYYPPLPSMIHSQSRPQSQRSVLQLGPREPVTSNQSEDVSSGQSSLITPTNDDEYPKIIDTITLREARRFYPNAFPTDFNYRPQPPGNWVEERYQEIEKEKGTWAYQKTPEFQATRKANLDRDFKAGDRMIHTPFQVAVMNKKNREETGENDEKGKETRPFITLKDTEHVPEYIDAKPLLSVLYQSIINHQTGGAPRTTAPKGASETQEAPKEGGSH